MLGTQSWVCHFKTLDPPNIFLDLLRLSFLVSRQNGACSTVFLFGLPQNGPFSLGVQSASPPSGQRATFLIPGQRPRGRLRGAGAEAPACQGAQGAQCLGKPGWTRQNWDAHCRVCFPWRLVQLGLSNMDALPRSGWFLWWVLLKPSKKGTLKRRDMDPGTS